MPRSQHDDLLDLLSTPVRIVWNRPVSLRAKLIIAALLVAVPSFLLSLVGVYTIEQEQRAVIPRDDLVSAGALANLVDATIDGASNVAWTVAASPSAQALDPTTLDPMLARLQPVETGLSDVVVFDSQGRSIAAMSGPTGAAPLDASGQAYFRQAIGENTLSVSGVMSDPRSGQPAVFVGVPIRGPTGQPRGVVAAVLDLSILQSRLTAEVIGPTRAVLVADPSGQLALSTSVTVPVGQRSLASAPLVEQARASGAATQSAAPFPPLPGDWLGAARVSPRYQWIVAVVQPSSVVLAGLTPAVWLEFASLLLAIVLAAIAALYVSRRIIGPVYALERTARALSRGDLSKRAVIHGGGEFAALGAAFNEMASSLSGTLDRLRASDHRLKRERNRLQAILDTSPVGILVMDDDETISLANPAADALLGETMEPHRPARTYAVNSRLFHPDGRRYAYDELPIVCALRSGETVIGADVVIRHQNGWEQHLLVNAAPIRAPNGTIAGSVAIFFDVTPLAEEERLRTEFVVSAAQEFRNPLTVIKGYAEVAMRNSRVRGTTVLDDLERIVHAANRLAALSDQVIHAAQVHLPALVLRREELDLAKLATRTTQEFERAPSAEKYHFTVETHSAMIEGDPKLLSEALSDLLRAAEAAMPNGGKIGVCVSTWDGIVTLAVTDHGPAVSQERIAGMFRAFALPGHEAQSEPQRPSLLLYLAKRIVEESGGWVRAQSSKEGTTVFVTLPRLTDVEPVDHAKRLDHEAPERDTKLGRMDHEAHESATKSTKHENTKGVGEGETSGDLSRHPV